MSIDTARMRDSIAVTARLLAGENLRITMEGAQAFVQFDPTTYKPFRINVPALPDEATPELIQEIQGYLDHEVGHILFTTWEVVKAAEEAGLRSTHNIVEDCFIERAMGERFPGAAANLTRLHETFVAKITPELLREADDNEERRFHVLLVPFARALAGQWHFQKFMDTGGHWGNRRVRDLLDRLGPSVAARMPRLASSAECLEMAELWAGVIHASRNPTHRSKGMDAGKRPEERDSTSNISRPGTPSPADIVPDARDRTSARAPQTEANGGHSDIVGRNRPASQRDETERRRPHFQDPPVFGDDPFLDAASVSISDRGAALAKAAAYRVYTRDHDRIEPLELPNGFRHEYLVALGRHTASMTHVMQKDVERMMASHSRVSAVPGYRSGRLHAGNLYRLALGDDRVFRRRQVSTSTDSAVSLLVDNSGSMTGEKLQIAMASAYALSETLETVSVPHECLGFTTAPPWPDDAPGAPYETKIRYSRKQPIKMPIYKAFGERLTPGVRQRFAAMAVMQPGTQGNIDGESIGYAALRLASRKEVRKVMIVLSDGNPAGQGVRADLKAHLHATIKAVTEAGIEIVGIGIMSEHVREFYPRCLVLQRLGDLPACVMGELRRILTI
ncbi:cobaltochelatase CobT-related protein [Lichenifustis flavocetrariae]|uniref:Cobalamin biosynthesis protein CobT VWA domain-containing protein n=1 Tax=Lichenifustis flavocetrariae TaxID=2949735 RepID=A0AA42CNH5_9HYPH|nr:hypothetical protein [Lichenifustis flavocetrariae]MCW6512796.1 hypothetical protein [Lichenifustis flavocetrariae]